MIRFLEVPTTSRSFIRKGETSQQSSDSSSPLRMGGLNIEDLCLVGSSLKDSRIDSL